MAHRKLPAEARRAATVEAVIELAATTNPADITTAQIAALMGVTQGALFRHFANKQEVWAAVIHWTAETLLARFDAVNGVAPVEKLWATFGAHIDFIVTYPGVPRILFGELQREGETPGKAQVLSLMGKYRSRVVTLIDAAKEQGSISTAVDSGTAATMFIGMVQGLVMQAMAADNFSAMPAMANKLFPLYLTALGART